MANLTNLNNKFLVTTGGNVGIGTTSPTNAKLVISDTGSNKISIDGGSSQNGMRWEAVGGANTFYLFNGTFGTAGFGLFNVNTNVAPLWIKNDGNVGIGTTSPANKLHVEGDTNGAVQIEVDNQNTGNASYAGLYLNGQGNNFFIKNWGDSVAGKTNATEFISTLSGSHFIFSTVNAERMRIDSSGNVGIGESSPDTALDVVGGNADSVVDTLTLKNDNTGNSAGTGINFVVDGANDVVTSAIYGQRTAAAYHQGSLQFLTRDASGGGLLERMRINSSGNIGIGTTSPTDYGASANTLEVRGASGTGGGVIRVSNAGNTAGARFYAGSVNSTIGTENNQTFNIATNNTQRLVILGGGNVGIGTTSPSQKLHVVGNIYSVNSGTDGGQIRLANSGGGSNWYWAARTTGLNLGELGAADGRIFIANGGNVGIGTISPATKLQVANAGEVIVRSSMTASDGFRGGFEADNQHTGGTIWSMFSTNNSDGYFGGGKYVIANESMGGVDANTTAQFVIDGSGNVGIGTASPLGILQLNVDSDHSIMRITAGDSSIAGIDFGKTSDIDDARIRYYNSTRHMEFFVANSERMRITSGGFVGIGTTSPQQKLDTPNIVIGGSSIAANYRANSTMMDNLGGIARFYSLGANTSTGGSYQFNSLSSNATAGPGVVLTLANSGNVGIGTTTPSKKLHVYNTAAADVALLESTQVFSTLAFKSSSNTDTAVFGIDGGGNAYIENKKSTHPILFTTNSNERMRITSGGEVCIGTTSTLRNNKLHVNSSNFVAGFNVTNGTGEAVAFFSNGTVVGTISVTGSATTYNTTSDYRLKEDLQDFAGLDMVSNIPVYDFKWKADDNRSYGVMAHELEEVLPQAVNGEKDAEKMQGVDYSKIVPLLIKSIQELEARVKELENK